MARFFIFVLVIGGTSFLLFSTKPTQADYLYKLESRALVYADARNGALYQMRSSDPIDEMVASQPPAELLQQTRYDDYHIVSVFTTEYTAAGHVTRRVRTVGLFSTLLSFRVR